MREPTTQILAARAADPGGLGRMLTISVVAHTVMVLLLWAGPMLRLGQNDEGERLVMSISLGGAPGPASGGLTPLGGRPIQQAMPLPEPPRPEPVRPPAARTPEMTAPAPRSTPRPQTPVRSAPEEASGRTPTRGAQERPGSAVAETGAQGMGFGLSTGGGGTGGYLDVGNFCCPEYLGTMMQLIQRNWNSRQEVAGEAVVKFTIQRNGSITDVEVERRSGYAALDLAAQRALLLTRQLPPLPAAFPENQLTVHMIFRYQR